MNIYELYCAASHFSHYLSTLMNISLLCLINKETEASEDI